MIQNTIPVSVVVVTKNEARNLPRCLSALEGFDDVVVVDSNSDDGTQDVVKSFDVRLENFIWNGAYPKKRQSVLDNISLKYNFVLFVDADEEMTTELRDEIGSLDFRCAGYFVKGAYVLNRRVLKFGLKNNKLALIDKRYVQFPVVDDLDVAGMGEIEGHYQPVLKRGARGMTIGQLKCALKHHAMEDVDHWNKRHDGYAVWQTQMLRRGTMPSEDSRMRYALKNIFYRAPLRGMVSFVYAYILKGGFLDGAEGLFLAKSRYGYLKKI